MNSKEFIEEFENSEYMDFGSQYEKWYKGFIQEIDYYGSAFGEPSPEYLVEEIFKDLIEFSIVAGSNNDLIYVVAMEWMGKSEVRKLINKYGVTCND
jgi:hypothetical protein